MKARIVAVSTAAVGSMLEDRRHAAYILEERQRHARAYLRLLEDMAEDVSLSVAPEVQSLVDTDASYLTAVFGSVFLSYVCRQPTCAYYGSNADWVQKEGRYQFRCPHCGRRCRPLSALNAPGNCYRFRKFSQLWTPGHAHIVARFSFGHLYQ